MAKVKHIGNGTYSFYCPGCGHTHAYYTTGKMTWTFSGDVNNPTFSPSLLNRWGKEADPNWQEPKDAPPDNNWSGRCHLFVKNGKIEYCTDCSHTLAGKTVEMKEIEN